MIQKSMIQQEGQTYLVDIMYGDHGTTKSFDSQEEANQYLIEQEELEMAKDKKNDTSKADDNSNADDGKTEQERHADAVADVAHVNKPNEFHQTPELPASEMSVEDAERINSNVNAPGEYPPNPGAMEAERTGQQTGQTQTTAPHEMAPSDKPNNGQQVKDNV